MVVIIRNQLHSNNKKVLLRERNRHTIRHVANAHFADEGGVPWGTPYHDLGWGTLHQQDGVPPSKPGIGYPLSRSGMGYPPCPDMGWCYPPSHQQDGVPPIQTWDGIPPSRHGVGYPPLSRHGVEYPPPPASVDRLKILQGGHIRAEIKFPVFSLSFPCVTNFFPVFFFP